ncbi:cytochrome p450 pisatin [Fusarium albosuccineum]|uniref:Cytochrome p450 pisatin n=1 Tax=Fusarium albosuccineum TaxID=1237068 RepID=A0A8H4L6P0_9HYPO|nr:cytochrome p450 pisatin [Fusarium albosuccineum]
MGQDFLSKALGLHQANPDKFPEAAIHTLCLTNFGAGSDTTCISVPSFSFSLRTRRASSSLCQGESEATPTGLPLARVVPYGGVTVSGTFFPEGTVVGVNSWVAHHNTDVFGPDADEFRPERWLTQDKERLSMIEAYWIPASTNTPARSVGPSVQVVGR